MAAEYKMASSRTTSIGSWHSSVLDPSWQFSYGLRFRDMQTRDILSLGDENREVYLKFCHLALSRVISFVFKRKRGFSQDCWHTQNYCRIFRCKLWDCDHFSHTNQLNDLNHCCFSGFPDYNNRSCCIFNPSFPSVR